TTARDQYGNTMTDYAGTIHFTSTDGQAGLPTNYTFTATDIGTHTFGGGVTLRTAGSQTVTATDITTASITGTTSAISVTALEASRLQVAASTGTTTAGATFGVTVTAQDQFGNTIGDYSGTVHFTS